MRILISGSSGFIGTALRSALASAGHDVVPLVRRAARPGEVEWNPVAGTLDPAAIDGADAVINLSGAGIGDKRWSDSYKRELLDSRLMTTKLLASTIAAVDRPPTVFLSGSAIGIYGPRGDETLDETSPLGNGFLADLCRKWEDATSVADSASTRVALLRTGIVLSPKGGALKKQLPLFRLGLGGKFGSGKPYQSWISLPDEVAAIMHLLTADVHGPVNLTAPNPVTGAQFSRTLGAVLRRPAFLPIPTFGPKLLLGSELADALLFTGQRVVPTMLQRSGFTFAHTELDMALRTLLGR
jgi:uncharacterized protein